MLSLSAGDGAELGTVWAETGGLYAGEDRRGGEEAAPGGGLRRLCLLALRAPATQWG